MSAWHVKGSYFEACNCEAICPCRWQGGRRLFTASSYGVCDFALSWHILMKGSIVQAGEGDHVAARRAKSMGRLLIEQHHR